ncbi:unnamed protein product [Brugia timori]|uniref:Ovule protein n=1 Tax=Brugia timori TaxID=42155 RepID=A0A0R3QYH2_9BILA|nr:unnamed protein product [Brugia timori]
MNLFYDFDCHTSTRSFLGRSFMKNSNWDPKFSKYEKQKMKGILKCSSVYYFHQNYTIYSMQLI